jgi:hypothetical protein
LQISDKFSSGEKEENTGKLSILKNVLISNQFCTVAFTSFDSFASPSGSLALNINNDMQVHL